jgi:hypothetical protein
MIRIKCTDGNGTTIHYIRLSVPTMVEMVFHGMTHDPHTMNDGNWTLEVQDNDKQWIVINWHYPERMKS